MKTIFLLRHGKSDWSKPGLADFNRPLANRGLKDAHRMGKVLVKFGAVPDIILSSPVLNTAAFPSSPVRKTSMPRAALFPEAIASTTDREEVVASPPAYTFAMDVLPR